MFNAVLACFEFFPLPLNFPLNEFGPAPASRHTTEKSPVFRLAKSRYETFYYFSESKITWTLVGFYLYTGG